MENVWKVSILDKHYYIDNKDIAITYYKHLLVELYTNHIFKNTNIADDEKWDTYTKLLVNPVKFCKNYDELGMHNLVIMEKIEINKGIKIIGDGLRQTILHNYFSSRLA